jgi:hypothetical protein
MAFLMFFSAFMHPIPVAAGTVQVIATWISEIINIASAVHRSIAVVTGKLSGRVRRAQLTGSMTCLR